MQFLIAILHDISESQKIVDLLAVNNIPGKHGDLFYKTKQNTPSIGAAAPHGRGNLL